MRCISYTGFLIAGESTEIRVWILLLIPIDAPSCAVVAQLATPLVLVYQVEDENKSGDEHQHTNTAEYDEEIFFFAHSENYASTTVYAPIVGHMAAQ